MDDLYWRVHNLLDWLRDAKVRVESALSSARGSARGWAPRELESAEKKYQDASTQMQAGDLSAAVDSMRSAGLIAVRLPLLRDDMDKRRAGVPLADRPLLPGTTTRFRVAVPGFSLPPPTASSLASEFASRR